jgi:hypothetical protein
MGLEVHVKDEARFPGKWAFFGFGDNKTATMTPQTAECYSCQANHAAVDTTFVQFYPTLLPIATAKGTLSPSYVKEIAPPTKHKGRTRRNLLSTAVMFNPKHVHCPQVSFSEAPCPTLGG